MDEHAAPAARQPTRHFAIQLRRTSIMGLDNPIHIAFLLILLLLVFGAKRLPEMGRSLGDGMRGFKDALSGEGARPAGDALAPSVAQPVVQPAVELTAQPAMPPVAQLVVQPQEQLPA
jgi:sec-independent protein translocase protein TatA